MKRGEWHERARRLHAEHPDWSIAQVARSLGVTHGAVWKVLNQERAREFRQADNAKRAGAKRAWAYEHDRRPCPQCGALIGVGNHRRNGKCRACDFAERAELHEFRLSLVEGMWDDGWPTRDIGEALGRNSGPRAAGPEIDELRRRGRIGYRYKGYENRAA